MRAILVLAVALFGCTSGQSPGTSNQAAAISEVLSRPITFPDYPKANMTYLSFSQGHGYQVNFIAPGGQAWLWYPGNVRGVPEEYKRDRVNGVDALCWRHPKQSFNPVTGQSGGRFACQSLVLSRKTIVAALPGDPFNLATGRVPYQLRKCGPPPEFQLAKDTFECR